jgi:hypothetical protein
MNYELLATDNGQLETKYDRRNFSCGENPTLAHFTLTSIEYRDTSLLCKTNPISETPK